MAQAAIATQIHQTLYVHRYFASQVTFNLILRDFCPNSVKNIICKIFDFGLRPYI